MYKYDVDPEVIEKATNLSKNWSELVDEAD